MNWPLNVSSFTLWDRLKLCKFFLNPRKFWTMTDEVEKFEYEMADFVFGENHPPGDKAVFVSSGSTANTILAMYLKDTIYTPDKNIVVVPSTTWTTSISPFIREGFEPYFIDINNNDLSLNLGSLEKYLDQNSSKVACIFITSLLGFVPDLNWLHRIQDTYKVRVMLDNCENTLGTFKGINVSGYGFTSTTSTYFGHQIQSVEGGFIFTSNKDEYNYFLMARNHGMVRALKTDDAKRLFSNPDVDSRFDFYQLGNNFRNTNINAFIGSLDLARAQKYITKRVNLYKQLYDNTRWSGDNLYIPLVRDDLIYKDVPFCIPFIFEHIDDKLKAMVYCAEQGIETRPIVSGNLLRQTCYKQYLTSPENSKSVQYPESEHIHNCGFYIGLHSKVSISQIRKIKRYINTNFSY